MCVANSGFKIALCVALCTASVAAHAVAQRTFVASSGSDANPCSLAQPCRSFVAAIAATLAGGEVIVLDSAGYGPVLITNSVSIIAPAGVHAGVTVGAGNGITINGANVKVLLRGLALSGQGGASGIVFEQGSELRIDNCTIAKMGDNGIDLRAPQSSTYITETLVHDNTNAGVYADAFGGPVRVSLDRVRMASNTWGLYVRQGATATLANSVVTGNDTGANVVVDNGSNPPRTSSLAVESSVFDGNVAAIKLFANASQSAVVLGLVRSTLTDNQTAVLSDNPAPGRAFLTATENMLTNGTVGFDLHSNTLLNLVENTIVGFISGVDMHNAAGIFHAVTTFQNNRFHNNVFDVRNGTMTPASQQ